MAHTLSNAALSFKASAPGTLMLFGEHAVLHNKQALVMSVDKRITISFAERKDRKVIIDSAIGRVEFELDNLTIQKPFQFILATIIRFKEQLKTGFELTIQSDFSDKVGLGSSAAITVATLAVMEKVISHSNHVVHQSLFEIAKSIIQEVQGIGSGADAAASVYGGVVHYQQYSPFVIKRLTSLIPIIVIYSGYKTPTTEVIQKVENIRKHHPEVFEKLFESINTCVTDAVTAIESEDWERLGRLMKIQQGLMNALGVGTPLLNQLTDLLNAEPNVFGSKISGSGLGDCVIAVSHEVSQTPAFNLKRSDWLNGMDGITQPITPSLLQVNAGLEGVRYE